VRDDFAARYFSLAVGVKGLHERYDRAFDLLFSHLTPY
jgi:hypothetical protein